MKSKQVFIVSERIELLNLYDDLHHEVREFLDLNHKPKDWLVFAKKSNDIYRFLSNRELQWNALSKIVQKVSKSHPSFRTGEIVDHLSVLVNTSVNEAANQHELAMVKQLSKVESNHMKSYLIEVVNHKLYIPRHPWMMKIKDLENGFLTKDLTSGNTIEISHVVKNNHKIFYLSPVFK